MATLSKRSTVYLDPAVHKILKVKSLISSKSVSQLINEAVLHEFSEDAEDLKAFELREQEESISFESLLSDLAKDGKI